MANNESGGKEFYFPYFFFMFLIKSKYFFLAITTLLHCTYIHRPLLKLILNISSTYIRLYLPNNGHGRIEVGEDITQWVVKIRFGTCNMLQF